MSKTTIRPHVGGVLVFVRDELMKRGWSIAYGDPTRARGGTIVKSTLYVTDPESGERFAVTVEKDSA